MARIRQVFPRETVAHHWAHGVQDSARDAAGNFYFTGPTLYSYGSHFVIGHVMRGDEYGDLSGRVLWSDASYSNTTSKQQTIAWRALTSQQRANRLHVPSLSGDDARAIDRAIREKRLPEYAAGLIRAVQSHIAGIIGKRHGSGPFVSTMYSARKYDETARAFYAAAGRKYPLDDIPSNDDIPADKAGRAAFVAAFSRAIVRADYETALSNAVKYLQHARAEFEAGNDGAQYDDIRTAARIAASTYDVAQQCERAADTADGHYRTLHAGKRSPAVGKIRKALQPIAAALKARQEATQRAETLARLDHFVRRFYAARRDRKTFSVGRLPGYIDQLRREVSALGIAPDSIIGHAVARVARMESVYVIDRAAASARQSFATAESYGEQYPSDALRCYREVSNYARRIETCEGGYPVYVLKGLGDIVEVSRARCVAMLEAVQAKEKAQIDDWIAGRSNHRPSYAAGTYARINGANIETSRGASVPIAHACRLARVFDRIVNAGGKHWPDGAGPMVGHYRVNVIGADGSLVIGCHEFNPDEARRLRDLLTRCAECQSVPMVEGETV